MENINFKKIDFLILKNYWIEVDHFKDPNKNILDWVETLGHFKTNLINPKRIAYGVYNNDILIGGTQLVQWSDHWIRYRTINVRKEYRGNDIGWKLLKFGLKDWSDNYLFGWVKQDHFKWAIEHEFKPIDNIWNDNHCGMIRKI